jgi:hypothetical protein
MVFERRSSEIGATGPKLNLGNLAALQQTKWEAWRSCSSGPVVLEQLRTPFDPASR